MVIKNILQWILEVTLKDSVADKICIWVDLTDFRVK